MTKKTLGQIFVETFVVGSFFMGLWVAVGVNPETAINNALIEIIMIFNPESGLVFWVNLFSNLMTIVFFLGAFLLGGIPGMFAIGLSFISGFLIISFPILGVSILIIAFLIGLLAPMLKKELHQDRFSNW